MTIEKKKLPAILGGLPSVTLSHDVSNKWPLLTDDDENGVLQIMRDGNISTHPIIRELEKVYAELTGQSYSLAHNNGTSALLAAFHSIGLKPGDEVLVPSATFWASILPMLWVGAVPVFCESESERMGIDPIDLEKKITPRTRAIVVVHLWGLPSKMTEIFDIAKKYDLKIIEDASHTHGAYWRDRPCGSLGDISIFSLQGDKLAPAGEGGILLCNKYEYYEKAVCLGDITRIIELQTPARRFAATSYGIKTRIAPISAAIGCNQLKNLNDHNKQRGQNIKYLSNKLEKLGFHTFLPPDHIKRVYFEYLIRYDETKYPLPIGLLAEALSKEGCQVAAPRYPLVHQQPFFTEGIFKDILRLPPECQLPEYETCSLPFTETANNSLLKLPSFPGPDNGILEQYAHAFEKVMKYSYEIVDRINESN
ncbi:MAG: DegT/DnrJ/EryC1/StrS family aminotransferase [Desulfobulbaceae bacterium]|nr:DegT/DnrJ/EryC1/StrS family aminotransferase [Desulfobulbaceae bacterium]